MKIPDFYDADRAGTLYRPDIDTVTAAARTAGIGPAEEDDQRVLLLLVDGQVDFIHNDGSLHVPGAVEDTRRTAEWVYRNVDKITHIAASLDTHTPMQIFYPGWWVNADGEHPDPLTQITVEDVEEDRWQPTVHEEWSRAYVRKLQEKAQKVLTIWPYHVLLGTPGHSLTPALYEAVSYHAAARVTKPEFIVKGTIDKTEYYSLFEPEVKIEGNERGTRNDDLLAEIGTYDRVYVAGQAKSHCVLESTESLIDYFSERDPGFIENIHILMDCTSSVQHPDVDFEALAQKAYEQHAEQHGLKLNDSSHDIE